LDLSSNEAKPCRDHKIPTRPTSAILAGGGKTTKNQIEVMLNADLTVVDNHASLTLPGALGSKVYAQIASAVNNETKRRIAATANSTPQTLRVSHTTSGVGFRARIRSLVRQEYSKIDQDTTLTDGVIPSCTAYLVIDRPVQSAGAITDTIVKNVIGALLDVILTSGQLDKLLNQEG
jgi:hypothetical protein